jgi:hypothetical protein
MVCKSKYYIARPELLIYTYNIGPEDSVLLRYDAVSLDNRLLTFRFVSTLYFKQSGQFEEKKNLLPISGIETRFLRFQSIA